MATEDRLEALGGFIRQQRMLADLSLRQLAEVARVSNPYLSQIERGLHKPSAEILKAIAGALHISAEQLYARAGFLDDGPGTVERTSVAEAIRLDSALSAAQKDALIRVYRSFVGD